MARASRFIKVVVSRSASSTDERIDLAIERDILAAAAGAGDELRAVTFENQIVGTGSVPDGRITGRFTWWFETKTARGGYASEGHDRQQLRDHAAMLIEDPEAIMFVLTPDPVRPAWFDGFDHAIDADAAGRIDWLSFRQLATAIEEISSDSSRLLGEQTRFLLAELVDLFETDGLLTNDDVVIVAARSAWPFYHSTSAYVCQPNRTFREGLTHLGFYADGAIQPLIPRIVAHYPTVAFTTEQADTLRAEGDSEVANLIDVILRKGSRTEGESYGVFLLSSAESAQTVKLDGPVVNDTKASSGRAWAWTLGQRYTALERLQSGVRYTSEL